MGNWLEGAVKDWKEGNFLGDCDKSAGLMVVS